MTESTASNARKMPPGPGRPPAETSRPAICPFCLGVMSLSSYTDKAGKVSHRAKCYPCNINYSTPRPDGLPPPPRVNTQETTSPEQLEHWEEAPTDPSERVVDWFSPFG